MQKNKKDAYFIISLILLILVSQAFVIFAHQNIVLNWFTTDDAFYCFKTAQNIAEGQGVTFDGIARTNGFHPLWMVLLVPVFTLARYDLILPLRLVVTLQVLFGLGSSLILFQFFRTRCSQWMENDFPVEYLCKKAIHYWRLVITITILWKGSARELRGGS